MKTCSNNGKGKFNIQRFKHKILIKKTALNLYDSKLKGDIKMDVMDENNQREIAFIDRAAQRKNILLYIENNDFYSPRVDYFIGVPGIGKTELSQYMEKEIKSKKKNMYAIRIDFRSKNLQNESEALLTLASILLNEIPQCPFFRYMTAMKLYTRLTKNGKFFLEEVPNESETERIFKDFKIVFDFATGNIASGAIDLFERVVSYFTKKSSIDDEIIFPEEDIKAIIDDFNNKNMERLEEKSAEFLLKDVMDYLAITKQKLVFIADTYELIEGPETFKSENWFVEKIIQPSKYIYFLIFGLQKGAFKKFSKFEHHEEELLEFSTKTAKELLTKGHVDDEAIRDLIIEQSKGIPLLLQTFLEIYQDMINKRQIPKKEDFEIRDEEKAYDDIFHKLYLKQRFSEKEQYLLKMLSEFEQWDQHLFKAICDEFNIIYNYEIWEKFTRLCIVQQLEDTYYSDNGLYSIHDIVKQIYMVRNSEELRNDSYKCAYTHYKNATEFFYNADNTMYQVTKDEKNFFAFCAEQAARYGVEIVRDRRTYETFIEWFIKMEEGLTDILMYQTKIKVLDLYAQKAELLSSFDKGMKATAQILYDTSWSYYYVKNYKQAKKYIYEYLKVAMDEFEINDELNAKCFYTLGNIYQSTNKIDQALWWHNKAICIRKRNCNNFESQNEANTVIDMNKKTDPRILLAISHNSLALIHMGKKEYGKAEKYFTKSLEKRLSYLDELENKKQYSENMNKETIIKLNHDIRTCKSLIGTAYANLARSLFLQGFYDDSEENLDKALEHYKVVYDMAPDNIKIKEQQIRKNVIKLKRDVPIYGKDLLKEIKEGYIKMYNDLSQKNELNLKMIIFLLQNNLAVIEAWEGDLETSIKDFRICLKNKKAYYEGDEVKTSELTEKNLRIAFQLMHPNEKEIYTLADLLLEF